MAQSKQRKLYLEQHLCLPEFRLRPTARSRGKVKMRQEKIDEFKRQVLYGFQETPDAKAAGPRCAHTRPFHPFVREGSAKIIKNRDVFICRVLQAANFGEMADAWKRTGAFEEGTVGGNQWAVEFHGKCEERGIVKRKIKLFADSRYAL